MTGAWPPALWAQFALVPVVIAGVLGVMAGVRTVARRTGLSAEAQRKLIHVAVGLSSLGFPLVFTNPLPVAVLGVMAIGMMALLRGPLRQSGPATTLHGVNRRSFGEIYMALATVLLFFRSQDAPLLYVLPLVIVALADAASALVGTHYGRLRFTVEDGSKSVEGVTAFVVVTWICALILLVLMSDAAPVNIVVISFLIAAFCALVEADSWRGLDNLFVPVAAHLLLARYLDAEPGFLIVLSAGFVLAALAAAQLARAVGLSSRAGRVYLAVFFLMLTVTSPVNATVALAALVAHAATLTRAPSRDERPELDFAAITAGVSLLWLLAGEAAGVNAVNLFCLTFAGSSMLFAAMAGTGRRDGSAFAGAVAAIAFSAGVSALFLFAVEHNPADARWSDTIWGALGACALLALGFGLGRPGWFAARRSIKTFALALLVPAAVFLKGVFA